MGISRRISIVFTIIFCCWSILGLGQTSEYEVAYNNGKQLFNLGKYELAMEAIKPAMAESSANSYAPYASFYFGVSAYNSGYKALAKGMFRQIQEKYPGWDFEPEIYYWLAVTSFEESQLRDGMSYSGMVGKEYEEDIAGLKDTFLRREANLDTLISLFNQFDDDLILAEILLEKMEKLPLSEKDFELISRLKKVNNINEEIDSDDLGIVKKDNYKIAVMLPFIYQNMEASGYYLRKSLVVDLYEGMRQASDYLSDKGFDHELLVFDTKGDSIHTTNLTSNPELRDADLIIGPLVNGPIQVMNEYSYKYEINMLNPISNNGGVIGNNPFAFLLNPSTETIGKQAGEFAVNVMADRKNTVIVYGSRPTDLDMAESYHNVVKEDSFNIVDKIRVHKDSAESVYHWLTAQRDMTDSLGNRILDDSTRLPIKEYVIAEDSIGSIFVSTFDFKIASEVFSAVAERGDSIQLFGHGRWLGDKTANYVFMEEVGVRMLSPNFVDYQSMKYRLFVEDYLAKHHKLPSNYVLMGYEALLFAGESLKRYGKYFQAGLE